MKPSFIFVYSLLIVTFSDLDGLYLGLKFPNMEWTNETAVVIPSLSSYCNRPRPIIHLPTMRLFCHFSQNNSQKPPFSPLPVPNYFVRPQRL